MKYLDPKCLQRNKSEVVHSCPKFLKETTDVVNLLKEGLKESNGVK